MRAFTENLVHIFTPVIILVKEEIFKESIIIVLTSWTEKKTTRFLHDDKSSLLQGNHTANHDYSTVFKLGMDLT